MKEWESISLDELSEGDIVSLLRKQWIPKDFFYKLLSKKELSKYYSVQREMVNHPCCPQDISLNLMPNLFSVDLLRIAKNFRISPFIRRQAETVFLQKWEKMPLGEKISHARRATPFILKNLKSEGSPMVFKAILENPTLTEEVLLELINSPKISMEAIKEIFNSPWKERYRVKFAIAKSPVAPISMVLKIIPSLQKRDLQILLSESTPATIKEKIKELLK
ncbi:MAG: hypothetical protein ACUVUG_07950 [Candidatus Aminicenantia bacterium]